MDSFVQGLRVIITAGASGIGRETAAAFLKGGAQVYICDISQPSLDDFRTAFPGAGAILADVSQPDQVEAFMDAAIKALGGVDVLVNNAGIAGPTALAEDISVEDWDRTMAVDINAQFYCASKVIPHMKKAGKGSIVNMSSAAGLFGFPRRLPYAAAKWAVIGFTKTLAMELGEFGIRVNAICPGSVEGPRIDGVIERNAAASGRTPAEVRAAFQLHNSMRTFIRAVDVANLILFICSDMGSKISGQALTVDGHTETLR
jgi:NAD(P)-dependent dehydrogenase (short-subunit alcohol dehydrogenase family)